jgi:hypothetical protein
LNVGGDASSTMSVPQRAPFSFGSSGSPQSFR